MRFFLVLFLTLLASGLGQTAGTVTVTTTTTIAAAAGSVTCTFTSGAIIQANCNSGAVPPASLAVSFPTPLAAPGTVGNFSYSGNTITWSFKPSATAGKTDWSVVANGTSQSGTF